MCIGNKSISFISQSLISHKCERIIQSHDVVFPQNCQQRSLVLLNFDIGFDGSTGQALYKQHWTDSEEDNNNLFATTFIPLRIKSECGQVLWLNPTPRSYSYCRPIHIEYRKGNKDIIIAEKKSVERLLTDKLWI